MSYGSVVNKKHTTEYDVDISRGSIWGNPFILGKDGNRDAVIAKYEQYLIKNEYLMSKVKELKGKILGCYCYPRSCHGDVLLKYANADSQTFTILSIDPGISMTGWAICEYDASKDNATIIATGSITISSDAAKCTVHKKDIKIFGNVVSLKMYKDVIRELCIKYKPNFITCEDAFYNPRTPNAFLSIKLCIQAIREVLYSHRDILYLTAPKLAKQIVFGKGTADKNDISKSIENLPDLNLPADNDRTEHECDAIAIAYTFIKVHYPNIPKEILERHKSNDFYIVVSGSRSISEECATNVKKIYDILDTVTSCISDYKNVYVVHGGAKGVDTIVSNWFLRNANKNIKLCVFNADWDIHGKKAGMIRNETMLTEASRRQCMLLAFHDGVSPGTKHAISQAIRKQIPVKLWTLVQKN